jgi:hypothetical protein
MEAPLSICTKEEMRGVVRFLFAEGVKPVEIIRQMQAQYSDNFLSPSKIHEWIDHFKKGRISVCDEKRSGRTSASRTEHIIQTVERMVRENRRIKEVLKVRRFSSEEEDSASVQNWLKTQPEKFFDQIKKNL